MSQLFLLLSSGPATLSSAHPSQFIITFKTSSPETLPSAHASQFITLKTSPPTVNLYLTLSLHNFHNLSRCLNFSFCYHLVQQRCPLRTQANSSSPSKRLQQPQSYAPDRQWKQDTRNKRGSAGSTEILLNSKLTFSCFLLPFLHFPLITFYVYISLSTSTSLSLSLYLCCSRCPR